MQPPAHASTTVLGGGDQLTVARAFTSELLGDGLHLVCGDEELTWDELATGTFA